MNANRRGFTLMEIMVVIIVIAVLASVAGPMITSITDQGRISATKGQMSTIKTALVNFNADLGKYPHTNTSLSATTIKGANGNTNIMKPADTHCMIATGTADGATGNDKWNLLGMPLSNYDRRWKGPYMDGDPTTFMYDGWQNRIIYGHVNKSIYVWSAGPDGNYEQTAGAGTDPNSDPDDGNCCSPDSAVYGNAYEGDDLYMTVARTRF